MVDLSSVSIAAARRDFATFCKGVLRQKIGDMHRRMIDAVMNDPRHAVIMAARGHFKTTVMSVAFPLWYAFSNASKPDLILIISATEMQSMMIVGLLKSAIEDNPVLREAFMPTDGSAVWSKTELDLKNGWKIKSLPFTDAIRGNHPALIIMDDVLKDESTNVEDAKSNFFGIVYPAIQAKRGKIVVVGTPMSYADLLHELGGQYGSPDEMAARSKAFAFLKFPCFLPDGSPQFPEHYSAEQLAATRAVMPGAKFSREYLCEPVTGSNALFPDAAVQACVDLPLRALSAEELRDAPVVIGYDVAVTDKEGSDYSAYTVARVRSGEALEVLETGRFKLPTNEQIGMLKELKARFNPVKVLIESTGAGVGLFQTASTTEGLVGLLEAFETKKKSKQELLGLLEVSVRNHSVKLPFNRDLIDELAGWENTHDKTGMPVVRSMKKHDDLVMSLAFALWAAKEYGFQVGVTGVTTTGGATPLVESLKSVDAFDVIRLADGSFDSGDWSGAYNYG